MTVRTGQAAIVFALWAVYLQLSAHPEQALFTFIASGIFFIADLFIKSVVWIHREKIADALRKP